MAASTTITGLTALGVPPASNDYCVIVDVSDITQAPTGTTKKILVSTLFTSVQVTTSLTVTGSASISTTLGVTGVATFAVDALVHGVTVGVGAGSILTNTVVGSQAMDSNTTGAFCTSFGVNNLTANSTGASNASFGYEALHSNTTGSLNTAFGTQALGSSTTTDNNTALGYHTLISAVGASYNVAVGSFSMANAAVTGSNNTAVGGQSLGACTSGQENVALGKFALSGVTTGRANVGVGYQAGNLITTGDYNVVLGGYDGTAIATDNNQIIISDGQGNLRARWDESSLLQDGNLTVTGDVVADDFFGETYTATSSTQAGMFLTTTAPATVLSVQLYNDGTTAGLQDQTNARSVWAYTPATDILAVRGALTTAKVTVGPAAAADLVVAGGGGALATNATTGFLYLSSCAGNPSGAPTVPTGTVPMVIDTSNNRIYVRIGGTWKFVGVS